MRQVSSARVRLLTLTSWMVLTGTSAFADLMPTVPQDVTGLSPVPTAQAGTGSGESIKFFQPDNNGVRRLLPQDGPIRVRGWVDGGYTFNTASPTSHFNGPYNAIDRDIGQLNQLYFIVEKPLQANSRGWDIGGRVDFMWGYDYFLTQSNGLERRPNGAQHWNAGQQYGIAIPQAYAEIGNQTFSVKLGHFYTIIGYEGVPSINNFFYSKSYSYQFAGPFTHWGGLATWNIDKHWTLSGGIVNGWDALDRVHEQATILGSVKYTADENLWSLSFAMASGNEPTATPANYDNRTRLSAIFTVHPMDRLEYVFHHHYAFQENGQVGGSTARWYGIDQYLYYTLTEQWKAGVRFEWMRDEAGTRVGGNPDRGNLNIAPFPGSFYSVSLGANYRPHPNVLIRPEVRSDWFDGKGNPYNDRTDKQQYLFAINANVQF